MDFVSSLAVAIDTIQNGPGTFLCSCRPMMLRIRWDDKGRR